MHTSAYFPVGTHCSTVGIHCWKCHNALSTNSFNPHRKFQFPNRTHKSFFLELHFLTNFFISKNYYLLSDLPHPTVFFFAAAPSSRAPSASTRLPLVCRPSLPTPTAPPPPGHPRPRLCLPSSPVSGLDGPSTPEPPQRSRCPLPKAATHRGPVPDRPPPHPSLPAARVLPPPVLGPRLRGPVPPPPVLQPPCGVTTPPIQLPLPHDVDPSFFAPAPVCPTFSPLEVTLRPVWLVMARASRLGTLFSLSKQSSSPSLNNTPHSPNPFPPSQLALPRIPPSPFLV